MVCKYTKVVGYKKNKKQRENPGVRIRFSVQIDFVNFPIYGLTSFNIGSPMLSSICFHLLIPSYNRYGL